MKKYKEIDFIYNNSDEYTLNIDNKVEEESAKTIIKQKGSCSIPVSVNCDNCPFDVKVANRNLGCSTVVKIISKDWSWYNKHMNRVKVLKRLGVKL